MDVENLQNLKRSELQKICKQYKLKAIGKNAELVSRIQEHFRGENGQAPPSNPTQLNPTEQENQQPTKSNQADTADTESRKPKPQKAKKTKDGNTTKTGKGIAKKRKRQRIAESEEDDNVRTDGITDEKFMAYVNAASDEDPRASNSSQEVAYDLPCVGKDSVFIPGKLTEPPSRVEISMPGSAGNTPVSRALTPLDPSKLIAKINPLMTSTTERIKQRSPPLAEHDKEADQTSLGNNELDGSYVQCEQNTVSVRNSDVNNNTEIYQNETFDVSETRDHSLSVFSTPTNYEAMNVTGNESDWLKSCQRTNGKKRKVMEETFVASEKTETLSASQMAETFVANQMSETFVANQMSETFVANQMSETSVANQIPVNQSLNSRRETFLIDPNANRTKTAIQPSNTGLEDDRRKTYFVTKQPENSLCNGARYLQKKAKNNTDLMKEDRRKTYLITAQSECSLNSETESCSEVENQSPSVLVDRRKTHVVRARPGNCLNDTTECSTADDTISSGLEDRRKTYAIKAQLDNNQDSETSSLSSDSESHSVLEDRRKTYVVTKKPENDLRNNGNSYTKDKDQTQSMSSEKMIENLKENASISSNMPNRENKISVNFCVCHGSIKQSADWKRLILIGGFVCVENASKNGERCKFLLQPCGKPTPMGYKDNMICSECVQRNSAEMGKSGKSSKEMGSSSVTSKDSQRVLAKKPSQPSSIPQARNIPQPRNKRKWDDNNDKENVSSPFKRRRSEVIIEGAKRGSPGSPQVRRARGEKIELSKRLLEPWKPRKNSIDPGEKREDTSFAKRIEEIMRTVQPGSEEEMALVMQKKPKLSNN